VLASLATRLREQVNSDIVRSARLIIRTGDSGQIRLNLKPEELGSVRVFLDMKEGHIAGRIIVENSSVRDVFEQNLQHLNRAFQEGGITIDNLDVTVADSGQESGNAGQEPEQPQGASSHRAAEGFERIVPDMELIDVDYNQVNLVV
jgi:flagellar hook-length control protein FliK